MTNDRERCEDKLCRLYRGHDGMHQRGDEEWPICDADKCPTCNGTGKLGDEWCPGCC
jgi:hypothetical protein